MTVLAEKLAQRKDLVTKIGRLDDTIAGSLTFEEGETDQQTSVARDRARGDVEVALDDLLNALDDLQAIENEIRAANSANSVYFGGDTYSISEAIVLRDRLKTEYNARNKIADTVDELLGRKRSRYDFAGLRSRDQVRLLSAIDPKVLREEADKVARRMRLLDVEIQKVNWSAEV